MHLIVGLDVAKKLMGLGFSQVSFFGISYNSEIQYPYNDKPQDWGELQDVYAAPTLQEIWDKMPEYISDGSRRFALEHKKTWHASFFYNNPQVGIWKDSGDNRMRKVVSEVDNLAELWLELKIEGIIK